MSLLGFQRALADLAASPDRCSRAIQDAAPVLEIYDLTSRERSRLAAMVRDRLMATNCVLYRANRITPIFIFLPQTCKALGAALRRELDAFWSQSASTDQQYLTETTRFAAFLKSRLKSGDLRSEDLAEVLDRESAAVAALFDTAHASAGNIETGVDAAR